MSFIDETRDRAPPCTPGKRLLLSSSSPPSKLFSLKRTRFSNSTSSPGEDSDMIDATESSPALHKIEEDVEDTSARNRELTRTGVSSDPTLPSAVEDHRENSDWSFRQVTPEAEAELTQQQIVDLAPGILHVLLDRGQDRQMGQKSYPTVIYVNQNNESSYQRVMNPKILEKSYDISGVDLNSELWSQMKLYIAAMREQCINCSSNANEDYPILHRHGRHTGITEETVMDEQDMPLRLKEAVDEGWKDLELQYGELDDIQHEQKGLVNKAYNLLAQYQSAIAGYDTGDCMAMNKLFHPLGAAFDELALNHYVIREIFNRRNVSPQFLTAIAGDA